MKLAQLEMVDGRLKYVGDLVSGMPVLYYFEQVKAWTRDPVPEGLNLPIYYENAGNIEETLEWVGGTWVGDEEDVSNEPKLDNQYQLEQKLRFVSAELSKYQDYIDLGIALVTVIVSKVVVCEYKFVAIKKLATKLIFIFCIFLPIFIN